MDRVTTSENELQLLRNLCDESALRERRLEILQLLDGRDFQDPDHQVVFESIRFLFSRGGVSAARLAMHLNNRGFPDIALEKYFPPASVTASENDIARGEKR
jgi:hypothetical protein